MSSVSVVITAWNEEQHLAACLESVRWADEIIVIDSSSTDKTPEIARKFTRHVFTRPNHPMLNTNKNYGFGKASGDWILSLDADEEIPAELAEEIQHRIQAAGDMNGFWIPRKNIIFGKWIRHGLWWPDKQLRLFRRGKGDFPGKHVHEYVRVAGEVGELNQPFVHYNYRYISQFIRKMDQIYTENEVEQYLATHERLHWRDAVWLPVNDFVKLFFSLDGYKDGLHGLVLSILQAFYAFVIFAKAWEKRGFPEQDIPLAAANKTLTKAMRDVRYWQLTSSLSAATSPVARILLRIQRKYVTQTE